MKSVGWFPGLTGKEKAEAATSADSKGRMGRLTQQHYSTPAAGDMSTGENARQCEDDAASCSESKELDVHFAHPTSKRL